MEPLNIAERRTAFVNFLIFFLLTVALIITAVFFSVQVPLKENEQFRKEIDKVERERELNDAFASKMVETLNKLDSVNLTQQKTVSLDVSITNNLNKMLSMITSDSISSKILYQSVVEGFSKLQEAKQLLRNCSNADASASELQQKIRDQEVVIKEQNEQLRKWSESIR